MQDTCPPFWCKFSHFHAVFGRKWPKHALPFRKSWINASVFHTCGGLLGQSVTKSMSCQHYNTVQKVLLVDSPLNSINSSKHVPIHRFSFISCNSTIKTLDAHLIFLLSVHFNQYQRNITHCPQINLTNDNTQPRVPCSTDSSRVSLELSTLRWILSMCRSFI